MALIRRYSNRGNSGWQFSTKASSKCNLIPDAFLVEPLPDGKFNIRYCCYQRRIDAVGPTKTHLHFDVADIPDLIDALQRVEEDGR